MINASVELFVTVDTNKDFPETISAVPGYVKSHDTGAVNSAIAFQNLPI